MRKHVNAFKRAAEKELEYLNNFRVYMISKDKGELIPPPTIKVAKIDRPIPVKVWDAQMRSTMEKLSSEFKRKSKGTHKKRKRNG